MTEKEELSKLLAPQLAWELTKTSLFYFDPAKTQFGETQSSRLSQVDLLLSEIFSLLENNDNFLVAIIPKSN